MKTENTQPSLFGKSNFMWMLAGIVVIALGMLLMAGGKSNINPNVFDAGAVYNPVRITVAPLLILIGLGIEVFAIFKK